MERECQLITDGYTRHVSSKYDLMIPTEIFSIIFMFYYMELFDMEYGDQIKVNEYDNVITNIADTPHRFAQCPTTLELE